MDSRNRYSPPDWIERYVDRYPRSASVRMVGHVLWREAERKRAIKMQLEADRVNSQQRDRLQRQKQSERERAIGDDDGMDERQTIGMQIGLDDSDLAIMESLQLNECSREDVAYAEQLIVADATDRQIDEIKSIIVEMRVRGILEAEIMATMRGE